MSDTTIDRPATDPAGPPAAGDRVERSRERSESMAIFAAVFAAIGVLTSLFAVGLSVRAVQRADSIENPPAASAGGGSAAEGTTLTLTEFKITPTEVTVPAGSVLNLVNEGTIAHDVMIDGIKSDTVDAGGTTTLDLTDLEPGTYEMTCMVAGHKDSGMTGTITIT